MARIWDSIQHAMLPGSVEPRAKMKITSLQVPLLTSSEFVWRLWSFAAAKVAKKATVVTINFISN
jgi:hypothetical protein